MSQQVQLLRTEVFMRRGRGEGGVGRGDENFTLWCCCLEMFPSVMMVRPLPDSDLFSS